jgi:hypothetical protein
LRISFDLFSWCHVLSVNGAAVPDLSRRSREIPAFANSSPAQEQSADQPEPLQVPAEASALAKTLQLDTCTHQNSEGEERETCTIYGIDK